MQRKTNSVLKCDLCIGMCLFTICKVRSIESRYYSMWKESNKTFAVYSLLSISVIMITKSNFKNKMNTCSWSILSNIGNLYDWWLICVLLSHMSCPYHIKQKGDRFMVSTVSVGFRRWQLPFYHILENVSTKNNIDSFSLRK